MPIFLAMHPIKESYLKLCFEILQRILRLSISFAPPTISKARIIYFKPKNLNFNSLFITICALHQIIIPSRVQTLTESSELYPTTVDSSGRALASYPGHVESCVSRKITGKGEVRKRPNLGESRAASANFPLGLVHMVVGLAGPAKVVEGLRQILASIVKF